MIPLVPLSPRYSTSSSDANQTGNYFGGKAGALKVANAIAGGRATSYWLPKKSKKAETTMATNLSVGY
jgi:hypothetical protein